MIDILVFFDGAFHYRVWLIFTISMILLEMLFVPRIHAMGSKESMDEKKLYIYSSRELLRFFEDIGYKDLYYNNLAVYRNSDGTALRFTNGIKKKVIIFSCNGSIKVIESPGYLAWLNDSDEPLVWFVWSDNKSIAHYANGMSERRPFSPASGPDPSGKYFIKEPPDTPSLRFSDSCYRTIYSTERPNMPLAKADICGATKIFCKDNKIYLTGKKLNSDKWQDEEIRIYQEKSDNSLEQIDRIIVPKPEKSFLYFYAEELSPWDDEMLFLDAHDFPSRSVWYSFNLKTRQLTKVGKVPWSGGRAFYLQCDILKKVTEKQKRK